MQLSTSVFYLKQTNVTLFSLASKSNKIHVTPILTGPHYTTTNVGLQPPPQARNQGVKQEIVISQIFKDMFSW